MTDSKKPSIKNESSHKAYGRLYFTGFSMGLADLVPGVSGGTVAFLYGIYDELLYSIKTVTGTVPKLLLQFKIKQAIAAIPFGFLTPLFLGIVTAVFGLVQLLTYLLESHPIYVWSLFFGLIVGSAYVIKNRVNEWNNNRIVLVIGGFIGTYLLIGLPVFHVEANSLILFGTGAIASIAMILPGISGSLIMVMLGQYENILDAVSRRDVFRLSVFILGAIAGLAVFSRLLSWLLHKHHSGTIAFLIGVMLGSLRKVWPWQESVSAGGYTNVLPPIDWSLPLSLVLVAVGFMAVWKLEKAGVAREHIDIEDKDFIREVRSQHD